MIAVVAVVAAAVAVAVIAAPVDVITFEIPPVRQLPLTWLIHDLAKWVILAATYSCLLALWSVIRSHNNNEPSEWRLANLSLPPLQYHRPCLINP